MKPASPVTSMWLMRLDPKPSGEGWTTTRFAQSCHYNTDDTTPAIGVAAGRRQHSAHPSRLGNHRRRALALAILSFTCRADPNVRRTAGTGHRT